MPITHETGSDFDAGGKFLSAEGWYHLVVTSATDTPTKRDGTIISGAAFRVDCTVAAGTSPNCQDKQCDITFFAPKASSKDGGEFSRKVIDRAFLAMNAIDPTGKNKTVSIEATDLVGQQFIAKFSKDDKYLSLDGANIYHVDDPEVKDQPKNEAVLNIIDEKHRLIGSRTRADVPQTAEPVAASVEDMDI